MKISKSAAAAISAAIMALTAYSGGICAYGCRESAVEKSTSVSSGNSETREINGEFAGYSVYEKYGLLYDAENDCYTYNGSVVRFFNDPAAGAGFTNFFTGTVDIEAVYDGANNLVGIKECSKEVYDRHTKKHEKFKNFA